MMVDGLTPLSVRVVPSNCSFPAVWMNNQVAALPAALAVSTGSTRTVLDRRAAPKHGCAENLRIHHRIHSRSEALRLVTAMPDLLPTAPGGRIEPGDAEA
jgi:hypothetical protein